MHNENNHPTCTDQRQVMVGRILSQINASLVNNTGAMSRAKALDNYAPVLSTNSAFIPDIKSNYIQHRSIQPLVIQPTRLILPFSVDTLLPPYVKSNPKFDIPPNLTDNFRIFFGQIKWCWLKLWTKQQKINAVQTMYCQHNFISGGGTLKEEVQAGDVQLSLKMHLFFVYFILPQIVI